MNDVTRRLVERAERGELRGADQVATGAVAAVTAEGFEVTPTRRRVRLAVVAAVVVTTAGVLLAIVAFARDRSDDQRVATSPVTSEPSSVGPSTAGGWLFEDGTVVALDGGGVVARFPAGLAPEARPVRVSNGFVAVIGPPEQGVLWFAPDGGGAAQQLDAPVSGVATDGTDIAFSRITPGAVGPTTVTLEDVTTRSVRASTQVDGFARVVGISGAVVVMATGDGGASAPGVWLPSTGTVTRLDGLGYTGAADAHGGRALLLDDTCADLVTMNDQGQITGEGSSPLDPECATQQWQIGPAPTGQVVGFGVAGHAVPLLVLDGTGATHVSTERVVDAVWHGSGAVTAIADNGELMTCAVSATCQAVRPLGRPPVDLGRWWLIPD